MNLDLQAVLNSLPEEVMLIDKKGNIKYVNKMVQEISNFEKKELIGTNFSRLNIFSKYDLKVLESTFDDLISGKEVASIELIIKTKEGNHRLVELKGNPYFFEGKTQGAMVSIVDLNIQKDIQKKLSESENKYKVIFNSSNDIMVQIDKNATVIDVNKKGLEIGGYKRNDIVGKKISALSHIFTKKSIAKMVAKYAKRMLGKDIRPYEVEGETRDGQRLVFEINAVPMITKKGKKIGELAILHDITERKDIEEKLKEKIEELEKMNKVMISREMKMIKMKEKIDSLNLKK